MPLILTAIVVGSALGFAFSWVQRPAGN